MNLLTLLILKAVLGCHLVNTHDADSPGFGLMLPETELEVRWDDLQLVGHLVSAQLRPFIEIDGLRIAQMERPAASNVDNVAS